MRRAIMRNTRVARIPRRRWIGKLRRDCCSFPAAENGGTDSVPNVLLLTPEKVNDVNDAVYS